MALVAAAGLLAACIPGTAPAYGQSAAGSVSLGGLSYPVPFDQLYSQDGDVAVRIEIIDVDYDLTTSGTDSIAEDVRDLDGDGMPDAGPVKISITRGGGEFLVGYAGGTQSGMVSGTAHFDLEEGRPSVFVADVVISHNMGPPSAKCPQTNCILRGDVLVVEYLDQVGAPGTTNTVSDTATFELRNGVMQTDSTSYVIGSNVIVTLVEPDLNLDRNLAERVSLNVIAWESDAADTTLGNAGFDPHTPWLQETDISSGVFQVVLPMPIEIDGEPLGRGEEITLKYTDWGLDDADYVGERSSDAHATLYTSNFGAVIELDQNVYSWTDRVYITVVAPDYNFDVSKVDEIGNTPDNPINIATKTAELAQYKLVETGIDTGIFTGEVVLTGFQYDVDGDGTDEVTGRGATGDGPTDGRLESSNDDGIIVTFTHSDDDIVLSSSVIRWNIGEIQWLEPRYPADGTGTVRVIDRDMNLNPDAADNFEVSVGSDTHTGGIDLIVTETDLATGIFEGTVFFTHGGSTSDHLLRVSGGDTVTAEYADRTLPAPYVRGESLDLAATALIDAAATPPANGDPFVTTWRTASSGESITIPTGGTTGTYTVDWGDDTVSEDVSGDQTHAYSAAGDHTVSIYGDFTRIYLNGKQPNANKLQSIDQWGDIRWTSMNSAFRGATSMAHAADDAPDLSAVTDMSRMLYGVSSFDGDLSGWDVSSVTSMLGMFEDASDFSGVISGWDVSSVTDMSEMFSDTSSFNSDVSGWDTSSVTDMSDAFGGIISFNGDVSGWDTSSVTDMHGMFQDAASFDGDISGWDTSSVTDMDTMFAGASSFDGNVSGWDVSSVTDMRSMFESASSFNDDISGWGVSSVTDMRSMFAGASSFNTDISGWDVSSVTDMQGMFGGADEFDQNLGKWYIALEDSSADPADSGIVGNIAARNSYLDGQDPVYGIGSGDGAEFFEMDGSTLKISTPPTSPVNTINITATGRIFGTDNSRVLDISVDGTPVPPIPANGDPFVTTWRTASPGESITIPVRGAAGIYTIDWGDGRVSANITGDQTHAYDDAGTHTVSMYGDFTRIYLADGESNAQKLQSIEQWGDIQWESMHSAFRGASNMAYNASDAPDLSRVRDMERMFAEAPSFDGDLSSWDVSGVRDMSYLFQDATSFGSDLSDWDVSRVTDMDGMFWNASSFDSDLSDWDVSRVTNMYGMFASASSFDSDLSDWDVSRVTDMANMFNRTSSFDSDLSDWDVSRVTNMYAMFAIASSFSGDIADWDVSRVTDMADMLRSTQSFNSDISGWNISETVRLTTMLHHADAFDQNLGPWYIVLDNDSIMGSDIPDTVGNISTRNPYLDDQNPSYGIGIGGDSVHFEVAGNVLRMVSAPGSHEGPYAVNVTSAGGYGTGNSRTHEITVIPHNNTSPDAVVDPESNITVDTPVDTEPAVKSEPVEIEPEPIPKSVADPRSATEPEPIAEPEPADTRMDPEPAAEPEPADTRMDPEPVANEDPTTQSGQKSSTEQDPVETCDAANCDPDPFSLILDWFRWIFGFLF